MIQIYKYKVQVERREKREEYRLQEPPRLKFFWNRPWWSVVPNGTNCNVCRWPLKSFELGVLGHTHKCYSNSFLKRLSKQEKSFGQEEIYEAVTTNDALHMVCNA